MTTENHTDNSAPLALATSLLAVTVSAFGEHAEPSHASFDDVLAVIRAATENIKSALDDGYASKDGARFDALDLLFLADAALVAGLTFNTKGLTVSPIRGAIAMAVEQLERELAADEEDQMAPDEAGSAALAEVAEAA